MLSEVQKHKFTFQFHLLDVNGNGTLEEADFVRVAEMLSEEQGWPEDSSARQRLTQHYRQTWVLLQAACDANNDMKVTLKEWLDYLTDALSRDRKERESNAGYLSPIEGVARFIFNLFDTNSDGKVSKEEHRAFCNAVGLDQAQIDSSFSKLDVDGDGFLPEEEVMDMVLEFYFSDDPQVSGNWLFGPVPELTT